MEPALTCFDEQDEKQRTAKTANSRNLRKVEIAPKFLVYRLATDWANESFLEPRFAARSPTLSQRATPTLFARCIQPGCRVAKTFANIIAAKPVGLLPHGGRFAQFAPRLAAQFFRQERCIARPPAIPHSRPDKMENLMHHNRRQHGFSEQFVFEDDLATPDKTRGMHGYAPFGSGGKQLSAM